MKNPATAHAVAIGAAVLVVLLASAFWMVEAEGASVVGLTVGMIALVLVGLETLWLVVRALLERRVRWRVVTVVIVAAVFALAPVLLYCGPTACFTPGPNRLVGWFIVGGVAFAALLHHLVLTGMTKVRHG
jgi:hypothetical protein